MIAASSLADQVNLYKYCILLLLLLLLLRKCMEQLLENG